MSVYGKILSILNNLKQHPLRLIVSILVYLGLNQLWGGFAALFLGIFVLFVLFNLDSRIFIFIGLIFFASAPFYLFQRKELMAEEIAIYGYYCLFLGVCLQIVEYLKENHKLNSKFLEKLRCLKRK